VEEVVVGVYCSRERVGCRVGFFEPLEFSFVGQAVLNLHEHANSR